MEEKERLQKEEKLNKADRNIALAMEELNNYRYIFGVFLTYTCKNTCLQPLCVLFIPI